MHLASMLHYRAFHVNWNCEGKDLVTITCYTCCYTCGVDRDRDFLPQEQKLETMASTKATSFVSITVIFIVGVKIKHLKGCPSLSKYKTSSLAIMK